MPAFLHSFSPCSLMSTSHQPVNSSKRLKSDWPCRTKTTVLVASWEEEEEEKEEKEEERRVVVVLLGSAV